MRDVCSKSKENSKGMYMLRCFSEENLFCFYETRLHYVMFVWRNTALVLSIKPHLSGFLWKFILVLFHQITVKCPFELVNFAYSFHCAVYI